MCKSLLLHQDGGKRLAGSHSYKGKRSRANWDVHSSVAKCGVQWIDLCISRYPVDIATTTCTSNHPCVHRCCSFRSEHLQPLTCQWPIRAASSTWSINVLRTLPTNHLTSRHATVYKWSKTPCTTVTVRLTRKQIRPIKKTGMCSHLNMYFPASIQLPLKPHIPSSRNHNGSKIISAPLTRHSKSSLVQCHYSKL